MTSMSVMIIIITSAWHTGRASRESKEKWQTSVIACEVAVHTTSDVLERATYIYGASDSANVTA